MYNEESLSELEKLADRLIQLRKENEPNDFRIPNTEKKYLELEDTIKNQKPPDEEDAVEVEKQLKRIREKLDSNKGSF